MRGRSIKEYEEQLTFLNKENFNLKLRIYFLEERMGTNNIIDRDSIIKENIELQIESKTLRNELEEKQDLLCQAVKAMELEEGEHKKVLSKKNEDIKNLTHQIEIMSSQMHTISSQMLKSKSNVEADDSIPMYPEAFCLHDESTQLMELKHKICELELQLSDERDLSSKLENEVQQMECTNQRCVNLEEESQQREEKIRTLVQDLEEKGNKASSLNLRIRGLEEELTRRNNEIEYKIREVKQRDGCIQEQTFEIEELRRMLGEEQLMCEKEQKQVEILKSTVMSRNNAIAELETRLEKARTVIRKMESKLETTANEVKRYHDEIETLKRRTKGSNNDSDSISARTKSAGSIPLSPSPQKVRPKLNQTNVTPKSSRASLVITSPQSKTAPAESGLGVSDERRPNPQELVQQLEARNEELKAQVQQLSELDEENRNTLKIARVVIASQKKVEIEKAELEELLKQKEDIIMELTQKAMNPSALSAPVESGDHGSDVKESVSNKSLQEKISELNLTASPPKKDNEVRKVVKKNVARAKSTPAAASSASTVTERKKLSGKKPNVASQSNK